ncbi:MAG: hypothetical protein H0U57_14440 [Tatlockia sp.]|nr:hypothetical protein [Tatlockia sp.]
MAIAINSAQTIAYIANALSGTVSTCTIDLLGNLVGCTETPITAIPYYDVVINPAQNLIYILTGGVATDVIRCSIDLSGTIGVCDTQVFQSYLML